METWILKKISLLKPLILISSEMASSNNYQVALSMFTHTKYISLALLMNAGVTSLYLGTSIFQVKLDIWKCPSQYIHTADSESAWKNSYKSLREKNNLFVAFKKLENIHTHLVKSCRPFFVILYSHQIGSGLWHILKSSLAMSTRTYKFYSLHNYKMQWLPGKFKLYHFATERSWITAYDPFTVIEI